MDQYRRYGRWLRRAAWVLAIYLFKGLGEAFQKSKFPPARLSVLSDNVITEYGHSLSMPAGSQRAATDNVLDQTPKPTQ